MRIAETDNTAQYWPNLGSQQSAIVIGPVSPLASVKCWADDGGLCWLFKFSDLQPKLFQYRILEVRKPEFGTASAHCCAENKCWRPEFRPRCGRQVHTGVSFQQRHDIGNRSSGHFFRCWASVGSYLTSHLGTLISLKWQNSYFSTMDKNFLLS